MIADVARAAGVSKQTVSRVFNDSPAVRPETRELVRAAMRELGYRPSHSARSLASGRTRMIGVVSFDAARFGPASILTAVNATAASTDYLVSSIALGTADRDAVVRVLDRLAAGGADGVIAIAPQEWIGALLAEVRLGIPLVTLDTDLGPGAGAPRVDTDSYAGAREATRHLLDLGHRTVHHLAGPEGWIPARQRAESWRATLRAAGAPVPEPVVGDWSADSGYELGRELLRRPEVTAVFAGNDQMAAGLLHACREAGRDVPGELSVVGYDDMPEARHLAPPLTTVRVDFAAIGREAFRLLLGRVEDESVAHQRAVHGELVLRASTGPPPAPTRWAGGGDEGVTR